MLKKWLVALSIPCAALAETPADRWNLADVYATDAAWQEDARGSKASSPRSRRVRDKLAERFKACLEPEAAPP
jgi:hypothetical protein